MLELLVLAVVMRDGAESVVHVIDVDSGQSKFLSWYIHRHESDRLGRRLLLLQESLSSFFMLLLLQLRLLLV